MIRLLLALLFTLSAAACQTTAVRPATPEPQPAPEPAAAPPEVATSPPAPPLPRAPLRLSIAAVGDMMIGTEFPKDRLPDDDGLNTFSAVESILRSQDFTVGNLEGVLADIGQPAKACSNPDACWLFRSPTRYAWLYRMAGFDALSLANNHARDFGEEGRSTTMQALQRAGIHHSGRDGDFASLTLEGRRVAFMAYAVTRDSNLLHDYALAQAQVRDHAARHDIVIVSFHGGAEGASATRLPFAEEDYYGEPRGDVVKFARMMVDAGADLVVGHGPHVVRAMERYKDRLIAYSLGNFATHYGISIAGPKGIAPILIAHVDGDGRFLEGQIVSTRQQRPDGPVLDPEQAALTQIRNLSRADFGNSGLNFLSDGTIVPVDRPAPYVDATRRP